MTYTINPNAKNVWIRDNEDTMDLSPITDASSVYLENGRTIEQELGEGSMVSNVATVDTSMSKIIDGTLDGAYESCLLKGRTLVNVLGSCKFSLAKTEEGKSVTRYIPLNVLIKPNTKYLYVINVLKNTLTRSDNGSAMKYCETDSSKVSSSTCWGWMNHIYPGFTGVKKHIMTTKPVFEGVCELSDRIEIYGATDVGGVIEFETFVVEYQEGMENWDIPYFEGMCSVKMPILHNVGSLHPFPNGLLCWYDARSGEGEQTLLEDLSGNENHATLRNFQFGGTDGWQDGGICTVGYGGAMGKNSIRTNKQINNAKSMCIYFKRLGSTTPWYLFDGRESSTLYWYSGGYSGSLINRSNSSKNGVQLSANNDAVLPEIGDTAMVYIEFTDNIPITPTLMGRYSGNESLDGVFYAFMLYDRALTTEEVAMNMEYAKSFDHIKDISPLDFRNIDKTNILHTSEEIVLRSLPNGVKDTYNAITGEYVQRIGEVVLDGSDDEGWGTFSSNDYGLVQSYILPSNVKYPNSYAVSDKLPNIDTGFSTSNVAGIRLPSSKGLYVRLKGEWLSQSNITGFKQYLSENPITVQYELATPITTTVKSSGIPFAYENGHVILESGSEEQSLLPTLKYSTVVNRTGQVESVTKTIVKQETQITELEKMLVQGIIGMDYNNTLLTLNLEIDEVI